MEARRQRREGRGGIIVAKDLMVNRICSLYDPETMVHAARRRILEGQARRTPLFDESTLYSSLRTGSVPDNRKASQHSQTGASRRSRRDLDLDNLNNLRNLPEVERSPHRWQDASSFANATGTGLPSLNTRAVTKSRERATPGDRVVAPVSSALASRAID